MATFLKADSLVDSADQSILVDNFQVCQHVVPYVRRTMFTRFSPSGKGQSSSRSTPMAPSSRSEQITYAVVPPSSKGKDKPAQPPYGPFSEDRRTSRTSTSQDMINLAQRPIIQPRRDASAAPSTETEVDSQRGLKDPDSRERDWRDEQAREIQNLAGHMREATGFVEALVSMLEAVEAIRKGHKRQFEVPQDLTTLYETCPPIRETFDHVGSSVAVIADKVFEYAEGVSEASTRVQKLARSGKAGHVKRPHGKNVEACLVSRVPALLKAANVLHGLRKIVDDCDFDGESSVPRFGSRDDLARLKMREKELTWLMHCHSGWVRELQHLGIDN
jgi:hypothetical protein